MHVDEVEIDVGLVARLVAEQFPDWATRPIEPVLPRGTDNALYRLGDDLVARLARTPRTSRTLEMERRWLPRLAPHLPLAVPVPVAEGRPGDGYPFSWSVYRWLPGKTATDAAVADQEQLAVDLANFIAALRRIDPAGGPLPGTENASRGVPLALRDESTRDSIAKLAGTIDADAATAAWEAALDACVWKRDGVWLHGDLDARNLLVRNGQLSAVVDFGCLSVGDPACDVGAAWKLLSPSARGVFRAALDVDDATWARSRGWALSQAVDALSYYTLETNAALVHEARRWLAAVLEDHRAAA